MDEYEELTEEEIRHEREKIRRRKLAARERRRKKRRQQAFIRCSLLLIIVILLITGIVKLIGGIAKLVSKDKKPKTTTERRITTESATTEAPVAQIDESIIAKELPADRDAALAMLATQGETDPDIKNIYDNAAIFTDSVLMNLAINSELKEFAANYASKINTVFDGEFTVDVPRDGIPQFLQYDQRWCYADYGKGLIATTGAGPTCLSMVYTYIKQDGSMNPIKIADFGTEHGYIDEDGSTSWSLMTDGAKSLGLNAEELTLSQDALTDALNSGKGIICAMGSGDFTKNKHFIVIREFNKGFFYVNDPFSQARSDVGWDYKRLSSQITGAWAFTDGGSADNSSTANDNGDTNNTGNQDTDKNDGNTGNGADNGTGSTDNGNIDNDSDGTDNGNTNNRTDGTNSSNTDNTH